MENNAREKKLKLTFPSSSLNPADCDEKLLTHIAGRTG